MTTKTTPPSEQLPPTLPPPDDIPASPSKNTWQKVGIITGVVLVLLLVIGSLVLLLRSSPETTAKVRDIFIIIMALEFLITGAALIILIVQLAQLIQLLQHEVKPILESTNETANTLRGTTQFLSEHLVEPVMKLNEYFAGLQSVFKFFRSKDS
jgi:nitrate reductase gamma subunit